MSQEAGYTGIDIASHEGMGALGGAGCVPLANWKGMPRYSEDTAQVIVELYNDPLTRRWHEYPSDPNNIRTQLINSTSKLSDFLGTSAVIVRPGPDFRSNRLYKVTLYPAYEYTGDWELALTLGVYPDIHRFVFGDIARSVLIEYAEIRDGIPVDDDGFYDVRSFYRKH